MRWLSFTNLKKRLFTSTHQRAFLEDLLALMQDGISLNQAIEIMIEESTGAKAEAAQSIGYSIASGQGLSAGMEGWFSGVYLELVRAGEESGLVQNTLTACIASANKSSASIRSCASALLYPALVLVVALGVVVFVKVSVLEQFALIKPLRDWPEIGRNLYVLATGLQHGWWFFLLALSLVSVGLLYVLRGFTGHWRSRLDNLPGFRLYRQFTAAHLMQTLGLLLNNGVMLKKALVILQGKTRPYLSWHLLQMEVQLAQGQLNVAEVLNTRLLDLSDMRRLRILAMGSGFATALQRLGNQSIEKKMQMLKRLVNYLGGFLLLCGATVAMLLVVGIYSISQVLAI